MKGEISRYSHRPDRRYSGLFWQMGRMLTDADEIELREIVNGAITGLGDDAVKSGAPADGGVVEIDAGGAAVALRPGIVYADGHRGQVLASTSDPLGPLDLYDNQVDFPNAPAATGDVVYYVDIWERTVTAVEDQDLLDAGLHGADTSFRSQLMAQIKWCPDSDPPFFEGAANPAKGDALLTAVLRAAVTAPDPCDPCAEELELDARVGNYLFRLEVHDVTGPADDPDSVTLKWSAENGAEHYHNGEEADDFETAKHIYEFYSEESEKHLGAHGSTGFTPTRRPLDEDYPGSPPDPADWPFVRRWDGYCELVKSGGNLNLLLDVDGNPIGEDEGVPLTTEPGLGHVEMTGGELTLELTSLELTLDTAGKAFLAGDYWLVEVRERAPHDAGDDQRVRVVTAEPLGIEHHFTRLIAVDAGGVIGALSDAERRALCFPPLTDIPASHVSFDNTCPDLYGPAENVQEALQALCDADFGKLIREHNRYLHGWGVICGLKVVCEGSGSSEVAVTPGCMIDQAGYQFGPGERTIVDVLKLLEGENQSGSFCLSASREEDGSIRYHLEADSDRTTSSILEGTLLWRIYQNCFEPIRKAWEALADARRKDVRWAFGDLLWPVLGQNRAVKDRPYLTPEEHAILERVYKLLQEHIKSPTDCSLAAEFPDFPPYPIVVDQAIHGMTFDRMKPEVRLQADGKRGFLFDPAEREIVIVDLSALKVEQTLDLKPDQVNVRGVHDVAANADGSVVAAAVGAVTEDGKKVNAILGLDPRKVSVWFQTAELSITELALPGGPNGPLYALARGNGIYRIAVGGGELQQIRKGDYISHLRVNLAGGLGWAVSQAEDDKGDMTYHAERFSLAADGGRALTVPLGNFNPLDLAVTEAGQHLAVVGKSKAGAELRVYSQENQWSEPKIFPLGQGTPSLAVTRSGDLELIAVSLGQQGSTNALWWFDPFKEGLRQSRYLNLQVLPTQIDGGAGRMVALNEGSRSLLRIEADDLQRLKSNADAAAVRDSIEEYRRKVIAAFVTLLQLWLKAVRDCICHQLLPDCPVVGEPPHKVPLASLELVEGVVDKICNLGCRKFLVTFPSLFYWMSIVPLIPWLRLQLENWCCRQEFDFLKQLIPDEQTAADDTAPAGAQNSLQQATANAALTLPLLTANPQFSTSFETLRTYSDSFAGSLLENLTGRVLDAQIEGSDIATVNVAGRPAELAKRDLEARGVKVTQVLDLNKGALPRDFDLLDAAFTPLTLRKGDEATLVTRGGEALFHIAYRRPASRAAPGATDLDLDNVSQRLDRLARRKDEIAATEGLEKSLQDLSEDRSAADAELENLKAEVKQLKEEQSGLKAAAEAEQARLEELVAMRKNLTEESKRLSKDIEESEKRFREVNKKTRGSRPVETLTDNDKVSVQLVRLGFGTVAEVAKVEDPRKLVVEGGAINITLARRLVRDAKRMSAD